jgi:hypothetical protein
LCEARSIRVFIAGSFERGTTYFAAEIYAGSSIAHRFDGWIDNSTAERAWLHALCSSYEGRDRNAPNARLYIIPASEPKSRRAA